MKHNKLTELQPTLLKAYNTTGFWNKINPAWPLPPNVERGDDAHLAYLTLVYAISGGRDPFALWAAAQQTFSTNPDLFNPKYLAYAKPADLLLPLKNQNLIYKKSHATVWQRIGQALVMRANGSVSKLLANYNYQISQLLTMLAKSKTTFPVLSGPQTAPRWLHGLAQVGQQPLLGLDIILLPPSKMGQLALEALSLPTETVSAEMFDMFDALGRVGCSQRKPTEAICPVADKCVVADFCQYKI